MLARLGGDVLAPERAPAAQQLVRDDAERVAVARGGRRLAERLLGRQVRGGAEDLPGLGEAGVLRGPGDALEGIIVLSQGGKRILRAPREQNAGAP